MLACMAKIRSVAGRDRQGREPFEERIETWGSHKAESFPTAIAMRLF
jgi:hypothetical protein